MILELKDNKSNVNIDINDTEADDLGIGEKYIFHRLIVMDDVSGLADKSNEFVAFRRFLEDIVIVAFIFFTLSFHN